MNNSITKKIEILTNGTKSFILSNKFNNDKTLLEKPKSTLITTGRYGISVYTLKGVDDSKDKITLHYWTKECLILGV